MYFGRTGFKLCIYTTAGHWLKFIAMQIIVFVNYLKTFSLSWLWLAISFLICNCCHPNQGHYMVTQLLLETQHLTCIYFKGFCPDYLGNKCDKLSAFDTKIWQELCQIYSFSDILSPGTISNVWMTLSSHHKWEIHSSKVAYFSPSPFSFSVCDISP